MTAVVALSENNVFGINNRLPWRLPHDMQFFKATTWNQTVVMGRATWESIPKRFRPLKGRKNIVLTSKEHIDGAEVAQSLEEIPADVYWIGGKRVLEQAFRAGRIHTIVCTRVHTCIESPNALKLHLPRARRIFRSRDYTPDARHAYGYHFEILSVAEGW